MTKITILSLLLAAFALPAHAGQWIIEETDDNYIVEYKHDPTDKPAQNQPANRVSPPQMPATPPTPMAAPIRGVMPTQAQMQAMMQAQMQQNPPTDQADTGTLRSGRIRDRAH